MNKFLIQEETTQMLNDLNSIKSQFEMIETKVKAYYNFINGKSFEMKEEKDIQQEITNGHTLLDQLIEVSERKKEIHDVVINLDKTVDSLKTVTNSFMRQCEANDYLFAKFSNEVVTRIEKLEKKKAEEKMEKIKFELDNEMKDLNKKKIPIDEEKYKKLTNGMLDGEEFYQLESWTSHEIDKVFFDSNRESWSVHTSVFDSKLFNKEKVAIIIEDTQGNKFGIYVNAKIDKIGYWTEETEWKNWIEDDKAFLFSLKSNNRIDKMMKFDIKPEESKFSFLLCSKGYNHVFLVGRTHDIGLRKIEEKNTSWGCQGSFDYHGLNNALYGKTTKWPPKPQDSFTPKHFIVLQMK